MIPTALDDALHRAVSFLHAGRSRDCLWRDFRTLAGLSSEWVSGFVAHALLRAEPADPIAASALSVLLERQRPGGGWGYNRTVPPDCDSTAWVTLALLSAAGFKTGNHIDGAMEYIGLHQDRGCGGFCTYAASDGIENRIQAAGLNSVRGWLMAHACVTGVALQAVLAARGLPECEPAASALRYVWEHRDSAGLWRSYWWSGLSYATYHSLKALSMAATRSPAELAATGRSLAARMGQYGAFETAFGLLSFLLSRDEITIAASRESALHLLMMQNGDGSWPSVPCLRIPPPRNREPDHHRNWRIDGLGSGVVIQDQRRLFTTAAAVWALAEYRSGLEI
jgi:squalene-hopene/tetraprenyl-beta-curcumene cyclase